MKLENQNILFVARSTQHGGAENVVIQLCKILNPVANTIVVAGADGFRKDELEGMGIKFYTIPDIADKSFPNIINVYNELKKIIKKEKISVIHSHHRMAVFYSKVLSWNKKIVLIATAHNTFQDKKMFTRLIYRNVNIIACGTMVMKNLVEYYGISSKQVWVIHNAIESFDEEIVQDTIINKCKQEGNFIVTNIGRLTEQKGIEYFIKAIPIIKNKFSNVKYFIIGDGEDKIKLQAICDQKGLNDDVVFMGYRKDVRNLISQSDFVVLSSLWEGLPLTPIEAFSVGKPVIATAVDGTVEVIDDMKNGILIPPRNEKAIANAIITMLKNEDLIKNMAKEAECKYREEFSFDLYRKRILSYYTQL